MTQELKVSFYLKREGKSKKSIVNSDAVYPIVGKIIIGNSIAQFSSKLSVSESLWNVKSGRAIGKSGIAVELNREINKINLLIHSHYKDILDRTGKVTSIDVKNAFQGIASSQKTLLVLFEEMTQEFYARVGIDRAPATYLKYGKAYKHLKRFLKEKYHIEDIPLSALDLPFIEAFDFNLRVERKMKAESIVSIVALLLKVVRIALHRNFIVYPPFLGYKLRKPDFQNRSLTAEEFERLISTPIEYQSQCFIRDLFVFTSFTGISYADLKQLTWKDIIRDEDSSLWISMSRQKTSVPFHVKLLDIPIRIMEKYKGLATDDCVFPVLSQGRINYALKIIARQCGIDKAICFHMGRHCYASVVTLSQGVPLETVAELLGHRDWRATRIYAQVSNEKIGEDMRHLNKRLSGKFHLAENNV
ncbi:MAG: tyrosine-type recombinase/integrase [Dysgonomonas sp.]